MRDEQPSLGEDVLELLSIDFRIEEDLSTDEACLLVDQFAVGLPHDCLVLVMRTYLRRLMIRQQVSSLPQYIPCRLDAEAVGAHERTDLIPVETEDGAPPR